MFSRLDNIFRAQERHAESLDTRQAIRRQEDKGRRSQKDAKPKKDDDALWQDSTSLSTSGLQSFLEGLIADQNNASEKQQTSIEQDDVQSLDQENTEEQKSPAKPNNARAAMAYQRTQNTSYPEQAIHQSNKSSQQPITQDGDDAVSHNDAINLTSDESRAIHQIINDLKELKAKGYTELTLERSDSLLQGIMNAISLIKNA